MARISGFIILCLLVTCGYLIGILTVLTDHEENKCEMTYMFEYPQFVRIHFKSDSLFKKYGLYAYSEGRFTQRARKMKFDGIPVLFIPGNGGSYKQVRSFASIALRKSLDSRPGFHFDFFTLDLNNELSGLNGALLYEQTEYANQSITRILELYEDAHKNSHKSVVIIGHSMGGIIARGLLNSQIALILTLATPHARPPIAVDTYMVDYYNNVDKSPNLTIVALSGGYNDLMVSPFFSFARHFDNLHSVTTSVPLVWLPIDHLCILWCKQLVLVVTRSLFDLVDLNTKQISSDSHYHQLVFQHHLVNHNGIKIRRADQYNFDTKFNRKHKWIENLQRQYTVSLLKGIKETQWHMIRLIDNPAHQSLTILALNLEVVDWVFACPAEHLEGQARICLEGVSLSNGSKIVPSIKYKRRMLHLNLHQLKQNYTRATHVVVRVAPTNEPVVLHVDLYNSKQRKQVVPLPSWWSFSKLSIIPRTLDKTLYYELVLPQLQHIIQSYYLYVEPLKCTNNNHHAVASLNVPWAHHDVHKYYTASDKNPLKVRLHASRPNGSNNSSASIQLTLDPSCTYSVSISKSFLGMLSQMARTYSTLLISNVTAVVLFVFKQQLINIDKTGTCSIFFKHAVKPYLTLTMIKFSARALSWKGLPRLLPLPDWHLIAEEGNDLFLLPLVLYMCSVGIVWVCALGIASSLVLCESTTNKIATKFLARTVKGALKLSDWLIGGLHRLPCIVAVVLVMLSISTCGGLALALGCGFYFLKLTQMSHDYVEGLVMQVLKYFGTKLKRRIFAPTNENAQENSSSQDTMGDNNLMDGIEEITTVDEPNEETIDQTNDYNNENENIDEIPAEDNHTSRNTELVEENTEETESSQVEENEINDLNQGSESSSNAILQENREETVRIEPAGYSGIFFHFSIFLLWCIVACLNIPSVITWTHNFRYNSRLQPDPSFLPGIILSICAVPLWQLDLPKVNISFYSHLGECFNILAIVCLIYAPISVYRLVYIITGAIVLITLHQLFAPTETEESEEAVLAPSTDVPHLDNLLNTIKAKLE